MNTIFEKNLKDFSTLSLSELNAKASYLKRIDRKFLVTKTQFKELLNDLKENFQVLEIKGKKIFDYDNVYMDTKDYLFYNQHENGEKSRTKVRTRLYKDSNLAFFEYKQKKWWITRKFRYDFPVEEHGIITKGKKRFFDWVWQSLYEDKKTPDISPSIQTIYKRITLVSKDWSERLTIDFDIKTKNLRNRDSKEIDLKNLVIIESKSLNKDCSSFEIMTKYNIEQSSSCSKYSLWIVYAWLAEKYDTFKDTMEKIKEIRFDTLKNRFRKTSLKKILKNIEKEDIEVITAKKEKISQAKA